MELHSILWLLVAVITLFPMLVFWTGYSKLRTRNLLISSLAFTLFFVKALTLAMKIFMEGEGALSGYSDELWWSVAALLDMIIISLIAFTFGMKGPSKEENGPEVKGPNA